MSAKGWMTVAILPCRAMFDAVVEDRFQKIEVISDDVDALVGDQTGEVLPDPLAHDPCLAVVNGKAFFEKDGRNMGCKALALRREVFIPGKGEVIGVAGVLRVGGTSEPLQAAINAVRAEIRQCWRGRRALRQVRLTVQGSRRRQGLRGDIALLLGPDAHRCGRAADASKKICNMLGISCGAKGCLHSCAGDRREEVLQVHAKNHRLAYVRSYERSNRSAGHKSMDGVVNGDAIENLREYLAL